MDIAKHYYNKYHPLYASYQHDAETLEYHTQLGIIGYEKMIAYGMTLHHARFQVTFNVLLVYVVICVPLTLLTPIPLLSIVCHSIIQITVIWLWCIKRNIENILNEFEKL